MTDRGYPPSPGYITRPRTGRFCPWCGVKVTWRKGGQGICGSSICQDADRIHLANKKMKEESDS